MKEWMKENIIYVIVIALLLLFSGMAIIKNLTKSAKSQPTRTEVTTSTAGSSSEAKPESSNEKNYRTAKLKLEHPYTESREEEKKQVATSFEEAIKAIKQAGSLSEVKGTLENNLSMSQGGMIQTLAMAILVNKYEYQSSKLEVMPSENNDVVQFLIVLTKTGEDNCYFVGNFNTTVNQIQLKAYVGGNIGGTFG